MKGKWTKVSTVLALALVTVFFAAKAYSQVAGVLTDEEYFPNMLEHETCEQAYNDFLSTAKPLKACNDLVDSKADLAVQQGIIDDLSGIKGCKACKEKLSAAYEAKGACQEQIKIYDAQCPDAATQHNLIKQIHKKHDQVCKSCKNKWPGNIGLYGIKPCSK